MAKAAPEWVWGVAFLIHGVFAICSLKCEPTCPINHKKINFVGDAMLGMFLWTSSTLLCFAAHWPSTGTWLEQILNYPPPAAMSGELWVAVYAWIYFIFSGSDLLKDVDE